MNNNPIYITQPSLPPLEEYIEYLRQIWDSKILTNAGPFHARFETELADYLGVKYISLFTNGTLALVTALQVLRITGEVITTPFSFVATTHALWWNNIKPVFVDIEPDHCNIDPEKLESAITPQTTGILPVHVYGNPCRVDHIKEIADTYGLHLIYDAAHAFGVQLKGQSILNYGDLSVLSFHATKAFNTLEGGAIICQDPKTKMRIDYLKNFGFAGETMIVGHGINAKMNELQAALGLLQIKYFNQNINKRRQLAQKYKELLAGITGISFIEQAPDVIYNYSYVPIFVDAEHYGHTRDELYEHLKTYNYYGRRYFYPLISSFNPYKALASANPKNLSTATYKAQQVLCLPIYPALEPNHVQNIAEIINEYKNKH